jgi:hypothetical protein
MFNEQEFRKLNNAYWFHLLPNSYDKTQKKHSYYNHELQLQTRRIQHFYEQLKDPWQQNPNYETKIGQVNGNMIHKLKQCHTSHDKNHTFLCHIHDCLQCEMESKEILFLKFSMMLLHKNTLGF